MKRLLLLIVLLTIPFTLPLPVLAESGSAKGEIKPAPWSGEWWSRKKGFLVLGWPGHQPSPFDRYDQYVQSRTGRNPGVHAWEADVGNTHYNPKAQDWEGHCNGWSAAAILEPEPRETKTRNGIVFETSDQKAILTELYMNTYCSFYGRRYSGNSNDDMDDIYPDEFHRILLEYIGNNKSAIVADTECDKAVWNFPIYKFNSSWGTGWFNDQKLKVKTTVYFADDGVKPEYLGTKWFSTTYTYDLYLDSDGNITGGEWTGGSQDTHPDFIWVPTSDAPNPSGTLEENPKLDSKFVHEIVQGPANIDSKEASAPSPSPECVIMEAGLNPADLF